MECGCAAQRLGMMDYCCLSLGWQQSLRSVCGQAAPQPERQNLSWSGAGLVLLGGMHRNQDSPSFLISAASEQQMELKMQGCATAALSGVSVSK